MSKKIYIGRAQVITENGQFTFSNKATKRGAVFMNPNTTTVYVHNIPIPPSQTLSIDVYPGEELANPFWEINLNGNTSIYASPLITE